MKKSEEYQQEYEEIKTHYKSYEGLIDSLSFLVEDRIDTLTNLEEIVSKKYQSKKLKLEASIRTGIKIND